MSAMRGFGGDDHNITLDAADDDWEWRRKIRSNPHSHLIYRIVVGVVGLLIVILGLIMVPFPGPGWLVVFLGLATWASEFEWAQRLLHRARGALHTWATWLRPQPWWVKGLTLVLTVVGVDLDDPDRGGEHGAAALELSLGGRHRHRLGDGDRLGHCGESALGGLRFQAPVVGPLGP